jgi:hypothetical protein
MKLTNLVKPNVLMLLAAGGFGLAACSAQIVTPTATTVPVATASATATIDWFPSTSTPSALPSQPAIPTEDFLPGVGDLVFSDTFEQPAFWENSSSAQASAMVTRNRLVLSITAPGPISIASLRNEPAVGDFYAEATAELSLCSGKDQYGMLFRASSSADFYRFVVNCNSQVRIERVRGGVAYPLLDWLSSSDAAPGAPAQVKLGVWAVGREMRVFLNDRFQVSVVDPVFSAGTVGFFIYANGTSPVTISFSDLSVYSVSYILPPPTLLPSLTPTP